MAKIRQLAERPREIRGGAEDQLRDLRDYVWREIEEMEFLLTHLGEDNLAEALRTRLDKIEETADSAVQTAKIGAPGGVAGLGDDGAVPEEQLPDVIRRVRVVATAGQTVTVTTGTGVCSLLMSVSGSTDARTGLYALQGWSTAIADRVATPIKAASSITIAGTDSGWSITTGTGTKTFVFIALSGEINTLTAS